ncbi:MAG: DnaB-like helicase N-terminal domain-containing protein, partial [Planctomycetota bacterium]
MPRSVEAERSVLGSLLLDAESIADVSQKLRADDFYVPQHRLIFESIVETYDQKYQADLIMVQETLSRRGQLDEAGGRETLLELAGAVVSAAGADYHAEIVREKAIQRNLLETCLELSRLAYENSVDSRDLLDEAERRIFEISRMNIASEIDGIEAILQKTFERIDYFRSQAGAPTGLVSGFHDLDEMTGGFQPGEL